MPSLLFFRLSLALLLLFTSSVFAQTLQEQRHLFLQAEQASAKSHRTELERLLPLLRDYPLYPVLLAHRLQTDLADHRAIETFLNQYPHSHAASQLRQKWLEALADGGDWPRFFAHYQESDGKGLRCLYHYGQIRSGQSEAGYAGGEALWLSGNDLPKSCDRLFETLYQTGHLSRDKVWRRFQLALEHKKPQLAAAIENYMNGDDRRVAAFWLNVHAHPQLVQDCAWPVSGELAGKIFVYGLDRLAGKEVQLAKSLWQNRRARFEVTPQDAAAMERRLALALALSRHGEAYPALEALPAEQNDEEVRAWRVRAALLRQDWRAVLSAWQRLSDAEKSQPEWRYWQARALEQLGDAQAAGAVYALAAQQRDFFGFLAADRIGVNYHTNHQPAPVDALDLQRLGNTTPFPMVSEWRALGRDAEARSEWHHALQRLAPRDLIVAAKLAQQWNWHSLAITTAARAGLWDDLSVRFPTPYEHAVLGHAGRQQLEPGVVYGLIRQESAFDPEARSPVGARGLMQIMPSTGQTIARLLREKLPSAALLHDPDTNLRYGTYFFKDLLERFQRNFAMAAAAYNAGPQRVDHWLPTGGPLAADIWLEQIPFTETRRYVSTVLGNAMVYQDRLGVVNKRRINQLLPPVPAGHGRAENSGPVGDCS
ncbi:MAG: lytic murein transglycosylase [Methylococcaceae bacterium]|nr:MAG: lytic murein transglycosylase [Methylococcaceae bacterium]